MRPIREEVIKILRRFGCEKIGFMDDSLDVAANYEHLAKRAEDRRTGNAPKP